MYNWQRNLKPYYYSIIARAEFLGMPQTRSTVMQIFDINQRDSLLFIASRMEIKIWIAEQEVFDRR